MSSDGLNHHFSPANIPFGIGSISHGDIVHGLQCVTRVHDQVIFLGVLASAGHFSNITEHNLASILQQQTLNAFAALPKTVHRHVREKIRALVGDGKNGASLPDGSSFPASAVTLHLPFQIGDFTDFSVSIEHGLRASEIVFGKGILPPGIFHFPIGYGGRCSSIVVSETPIKRPVGQYVESRDAEGKANVVFAPSQKLDYELEIGVVVGKPVAMNSRVMATEADEHIFGIVLVNDWSARDIQALEMTPLGPLHGKNFGTTVSPWVVTLDALEPFHIANTEPRSPQAAYLRDDGKGNYDISLVVEVTPASSRPSTVTCRSTSKDSLYWNFRQLLAHQAIGGCGLASGDLLATGTVSGTSKEAMGCLLESTWGGQRPLTLEGGGQRGYLEDGDTVRFTAVAGGEDSGVGFGECIGQIQAADPF